MFVENSKADQLLLGGIVNGKLVGSECLIDTRHCLFGQMLLKVLLIKYLQLKLGIVGCLFEVTHPELCEEGTGVSGSLQVDPQLARQRFPLLFT